MKILNIRAFVPSGKDYSKSKEFFVDLGFTIRFDGGGFCVMERDGCEFFLQNFHNEELAHNFMMAVGVDNAEEFRNQVIEKKLPEKYGIKVWPVVTQPYGKEVNISDVAGCLWHFVEPPAQS